MSSNWIWHNTQIICSAWKQRKVVFFSSFMKVEVCANVLRVECFKHPLPYISPKILELPACSSLLSHPRLQTRGGSHWCAPRLAHCVLGDIFMRQAKREPGLFAQWSVAEWARTWTPCSYRAAVWCLHANIWSVRLGDVGQVEGRRNAQVKPEPCCWKPSTLLPRAVRPGMLLHMDTDRTTWQHFAIKYSPCTGANALSED